MRNGDTLLGTFNWSQINIGGLGYVTGLVHASDGSASWCRTDVGGAYRREGTSGKWTQMVSRVSIPSGIIAAGSVGGGGSSFGVWELDSAPSDPNILWMCFRGRALRSADRGVTFTDTNLNGTTGVYMNSNGPPQKNTSNKMVVDPSNAEIVYIGSTRDGLWRRMSGTWSQIASVPASSATGDENKAVFVCVDPTSALTGSGATSRRSVVYAASVGQGVYRSTDGGTTFTLMSGHPGAGTSFATMGMTIDQNGKLILALNNAASNNVWTWNGTSWTNLTFTSNILWLHPDPKNASRWVGRAAGNPVITEDAGSTFRMYNPPSNASVPTSVPIISSVLEAGFRGSASASFACIKPHPVLSRDYIAEGLGVHYIAAWPIPGDKNLIWVEDAAGIEELVTHDATITPNGDTLLCSHDRGVIRAPNDGSFPQQAYPVTTLTNGYKVDWAIDDPSWLACLVIKNGNHSGISTDGGRSWTPFATSYGTGEGGTIAVSNKAQIVVAPGQNRWPKYSHDFGVTWTDCTFAGQARIPDGTESGFGFSNTSTRRHILCADKDTPGTFYIYNYGPSAATGMRGLWKSTDGGINWINVNNTYIIPSSYIGFHVVLKCVQGDLYLTSGGTGSWFGNEGGATVLRSENGGVSWTTIAGATEATIAFGKPPHGGTYPTMYLLCWLNGSYGLHRSYDKGVTIEPLTTYTNYDEDFALAADPTKFGRVVVGFSGTGWIERTYEYTMRLS